MGKRLKINCIFLISLYLVSFIPANVSAQTSTYNVCNYSYAPLLTTSSNEYFNTLDCDYNSVGDYEVWDDYKIAYISSSSHYEYYIYISSDKVGSYLNLKLSEYSDDLDFTAFDIDLELYSPSGYFLEGSYADQNIDEYIYETLTETGYYKVRVERYSGAGEFMLERTLTENKGPTGNMEVGAPVDSLFMHEKIFLDACDSYDVGGGSVYFDWTIDGTSQTTTDCEMTVILHDTQTHEICVTVSDYYEKGFTDCESLSARDPFSGISDDWNEHIQISSDSNNIISMWDKSGTYKAPYLDFWFKLGIRNDYKVITQGTWDLDTEVTWNDNTISTTFSVNNVDTKHEVFLRPTFTFEYYSSNSGWQTLDIPLVTSEAVYYGQPSIEVYGLKLYYWNDFVRISDNSIDFEDNFYSNSFMLGDYITLSEVDLYPLVRQMLDYGTQGVTGASQFLDFMEDWSQIRIPLSYDLQIGFTGFEYTGLIVKPINTEISSIEEHHSSGWDNFIEPDATHVGYNNLETYEFGLTKIPEDSTLSHIGDYIPSEVKITSFDNGRDQVDYNIMQYSDIIINNYQQPSINIGVESSWGDEYWTIAEFTETESSIISRTSTDTNLMLSAIRDSDDDGVKNIDDTCEDTPDNIGVLSDGCPESLLDRVLTGQGDMVPIYGISGGVIFALIALFVVTLKRASKRGRRNISINSNYNYVDNSDSFVPRLPPIDQPNYGNEFDANSFYSPPREHHRQDNFLQHDASFGSFNQGFEQNVQNEIQTYHSLEQDQINSHDFGMFNQPQESSQFEISDEVRINDDVNAKSTIATPPYELKGEVDSEGYEWLDYSGAWWWRNSPLNHWAIFKD